MDDSVEMKIVIVSNRVSLYQIFLNNFRQIISGVVLIVSLILIVENLLTSQAYAFGNIFMYIEHSWCWMRAMYFECRFLILFAFTMPFLFDADLFDGSIH